MPPSAPSLLPSGCFLFPAPLWKRAQHCAPHALPSLFDGRQMRGFAHPQPHETFGAVRLSTTTSRLIVAVKTAEATTLALSFSRCSMHSETEATQWGVFPMRPRSAQVLGRAPTVAAVTRSTTRAASPMLSSKLA